MVKTEKKLTDLDHAISTLIVVQESYAKEKEKFDSKFLQSPSYAIEWCFGVVQDEIESRTVTNILLAYNEKLIFGMTDVEKAKILHELVSHVSEELTGRLIGDFDNGSSTDPFHNAVAHATRAANSALVKHTLKQCLIYLTNFINGVKYRG